MSSPVPRFLPILAALHLAAATSHAVPLEAGAARVDITDYDAGPVHDPSYAKALVLRQGQTVAVLLTVDAVAIGEIGRLGNDFLPALRASLADDPGIPPSSILVNASHCHATVRRDTATLAAQAVREAWHALEPVHAGTGSAQENRISENRRLLLKDGRQIDMRRAYALPRDEDIAALGPIDPEIGILRLDRLDGRPLALLYQFACHPIMNPPSKGSSADFPGVASQLIEEGLGPGVLAFFLQGCGGDINPARYKEVNRPPDAGPLGHLLGHAVLRAARGITTHPGPPLHIARETLALPRAADFPRRITSLEEEQSRLVRSLKPNNLNFKSFLPLLIQQRLSPDYPSHYAPSYLQERSLPGDSLERLDAENRAAVAAYLENIQAMEELTRLNTNLSLLRKHLEQTKKAPSPFLEVEIGALRIGDFRLVTFPGELSVQVGLNLKKAAPHPFSYVSGYTNGYIYYTPTVAQRNNTGYAQEDCDTLVAPEWQALFQARALELLQKL